MISSPMWECCRFHALAGPQDTSERLMVSGINNRKQLGVMLFLVCCNTMSAFDKTIRISGHAIMHT